MPTILHHMRQFCTSTKDLGWRCGENLRLDHAWNGLFAAQNDRNLAHLRGWRTPPTYTGASFAERLEVDIATISRLERGEIPINQDFERAALALIERNVVDLLTIDPLPRPPNAGFTPTANCPKSRSGKRLWLSMTPAKGQLMDLIRIAAYVAAGFFHLQYGTATSPGWFPDHGGNSQIVAPLCAWQLRRFRPSRRSTTAENRHHRNMGVWLHVTDRISRLPISSALHRFPDC